MSEHIFGRNNRLDKSILEEKASKPLDVQGDVNVNEINHDQVCQEFGALLGITKMDRHWKVLMMLRLSGLPIDLALMMAQKHGFLKGVRIHEAQIIETAALAKLKDTLRGRGIASVVDEHDRSRKDTELQTIVAVTDKVTPIQGETCQN